MSATPDPFTATTVNGQRLCRAVTPFKAQTQVKGYWSYQLPADFVVSGAVQNISGPQVTATYTATNAEVAPGWAAIWRRAARGPRARQQQAVFL